MSEAEKKTIIFCDVRGTAHIAYPYLKEIKQARPDQEMRLATTYRYITKHEYFGRDFWFTDNLAERIFEPKAILAGVLRDMYKGYDDDGEDLKIRGEDFKLDPESWEVIAKRLGVEPSQLVLIDDNKSNRDMIKMAGGLAIDPDDKKAMQAFVKSYTAGALVNEKPAAKKAVPEELRDFASANARVSYLPKSADPEEYKTGICKSYPDLQFGMTLPWDHPYYFEQKDCLHGLACTVALLSNIMQKDGVDAEISHHDVSLNCMESYLASYKMVHDMSRTSGEVTQELREQARDYVRDLGRGGSLSFLGEPEFVDLFENADDAFLNAWAEESAAFAAQPQPTVS